MIVTAGDSRLRRIAKRAFWNGIEVTNDCFEFFVDEEQPEQSWVKVFIRDANGKFILDPTTIKPKWKLLKGEVTCEPSIQELKKVLEGVK